MLAGMVGWSLSIMGYPLVFPNLFTGIGAYNRNYLCNFVSLIVERFIYRYFKMKHGDATEHAIPLVFLGFINIRISNFDRTWIRH